MYSSTFLFIYLFFTKFDINKVVVLAWNLTHWITKHEVKQKFKYLKKKTNAEIGKK